MNTCVLEREHHLAAPLNDAFAFFAEAANLKLITPPWLRYTILSRTPVELRTGARIEYRIDWHHAPLRWRTEVVAWSPAWQLLEDQRPGRYPFWQRTRLCEPNRDGTLVHDVVRYNLPPDILGSAAHCLAVCQELRDVFIFRHRRIEELFRDAPLPL